MHNLSAHQLTQYYQPQQVPSMDWTALVTWYIHCKPARNKILQNFWLTLVIFLSLTWRKLQDRVKEKTMKVGKVKKIFL